MTVPAEDKKKPIVDIVFERTSSSYKFWPYAVALAASTGIHLGVVLSSLQDNDSKLKVWMEDLGGKIHAQMSREIVVENPPPPLPAKPEPPPVRQPAAPKTKAAPKAPAKAAQVIAQAPAPDAPVDMSDTAFVTGTADSYAGGVTASSGTSDTAVEASDQSRAVSLDENNWNCGWPVAAESQSMNEQSAVIKVLVRVDGTVKSATIVSDPGSGFGDAAVACALHTQFKPALSAKGEPVEAQSPPIRVRFTR